MSKLNIKPLADRVF